MTAAELAPGMSIAWEHGPAKVLQVQPYRRAVAVELEYANSAGRLVREVYSFGADFKVREA